MRFSTLSTAAFAAGALAGPIKRDVVYVTDVQEVYATVYTTVDGAAPTPAAYAAADNNDNAPVVYATTYVEAPAAKPTHAPAPPAYSAPAPVHSAPAYTPPPVVYSTPQPVAPAPAPSSAAPASGSSGNGGNYGMDSVTETYQKQVLLHHNIHRANHSAPDVAWDDNLAASAQIVANTCIYAHKVDVMGGGYGQNIAAGPHAADVGDVLTDMFYNGEMCAYEDLYGQESPSMADFDTWGHFSQMVWSGTTHVGCATADCSAQGLANVGGAVPPYFTVCNYRTAGNMAGEYGSNINKPLGHPTVQGSFKGN